MFPEDTLNCRQACEIKDVPRRPTSGFTFRPGHCVLVFLVVGGKNRSISPDGGLRIVTQQRAENREQLRKERMKLIIKQHGKFTFWPIASGCIPMSPFLHAKGPSFGPKANTRTHTHTELMHKKWGVTVLLNQLSLFFARQLQPIRKFPPISERACVF